MLTYPEVSGLYVISVRLPVGRQVDSQLRNLVPRLTALGLPRAAQALAPRVRHHLNVMPLPSASSL